MPSARVPDYSAVGLKFASALAGRDYSTAYALTSRDYQRSATLDEMRAAFEAIVPPTWQTVGPVEVGQAADAWQGGL